MFIKELFANLCILVALLFMYAQFSSESPLRTSSSLIRKTLVGVLGGLLGNILMQYSIHIGSTMIDLRHIPIILLAYAGGALPALVSMTLIALGRFLIGINQSAYSAFAMMASITCFSIYFSRSHFTQAIKKFSILTFGNLAFSMTISYLIRDVSLLVRIIPIYWAVSYLSGYMAFYILDLLRTNQMLFKKFQAESTIDGLTGLNNVRKFDEVFNQLVSALKTNGQKLSLLYIDIDFFKKINDTYGHSEGDVVLRELGALLKKCTRSFDIVSRNGGEEFTVLLQDCPLDRALQIAERIRNTVESHSFSLNNGKEITLTVSVGVACYLDTTKDPALLIDDADKALYQAKNSGRNLVCVANF